MYTLGTMSKEGGGTSSKTVPCSSASSTPAHPRQPWPAGRHLAQQAREMSMGHCVLDVGILRPNVRTRRKRQLHELLFRCRDLILTPSGIARSTSAPSGATTEASVVRVSPCSPVGEPVPYQSSNLLKAHNTEAGDRGRPDRTSFMGLGCANRGASVTSADRSSGPLDPSGPAQGSGSQLANGP